MTQETLQVRTSREHSVVLWCFPGQYQNVHESNGAWLHSAARSLPEPCMSDWKRQKQLGVSVPPHLRPPCAHFGARVLLQLPKRRRSDSGWSGWECRSLGALLKKYDWICCAVKIRPLWTVLLSAGSAHNACRSPHPLDQVSVLFLVQL